MRVFALSDIHVDYEENLRWIEELPRSEYVNDVLILAGDISHDRQLFVRALEELRGRFCRVFFVPGNHDLWLRSDDPGTSLDKCEQLLDCCRQMDVQTEPACVHGRNHSPAVWIVPIYSWYVKPEEDPAESLFVPKRGEDSRMRMWVDNRAIRWPSFDGQITPAAYFLSRNSAIPDAKDDAVVISFSHFVPRRELLFPTLCELKALGLPPIDPQPRFNFSRVAGCHGLERTIRSLRSRIHLYGHQHRNRRRHIDGITYISHCLGYPRERLQGRIARTLREPLMIWDTDNPAPYDMPKKTIRDF